MRDAGASGPGGPRGPGGAGSLAAFTALSAALTGYDEAELHGTGMIETYWDTLNGVVGGRIVGELLSAWQDALLAGGGDPDRTARALAEGVLEDEKLGPVARNLTVLWYLGQWNQMPVAWRDRWGAAATDLTRVVSAAAYREGLVWDAIGAHPMGAKQQGFGAWSLPPRGVRDVPEVDDV